MKMKHCQIVCKLFQIGYDLFFHEELHIALCMLIQCISIKYKPTMWQSKEQTELDA